MDTRPFHFDLPRDRIAQFPAKMRDESRLLVLDRETGGIHHSRFSQIGDWLSAGDLLVANDTRVIPARIIGRKPTGGKVEILLCEPLGDQGDPVAPVEESGAFESHRWRCLVRGRGKLADGIRVALSEGVEGTLERKGRDGWAIRFSDGEDLRRILEKVGEMPLPPYIRRDPEPLDRDRYQTVFGKRDGAIAAPTAGLHFTRELIELLARRGVHFATVTLQVGVGTFQPLRPNRDGICHVLPEYMEIGTECCRAWREVRARGGRIVAVGTTTVRALESAAGDDGRIAPRTGYTSLFIRPGHRFRAVDALVTNFHLPGTPLLMLVSAFAGKEKVQMAYKEAIGLGYRFYSYGDAMLIL